MFDKFKVDKNPAFVMRLPQNDFMTIMMVVILVVVVVVMVMVVQTSHIQQRHLAQHDMTATP